MKNQPTPVFLAAVLAALSLPGCAALAPVFAPSAHQCPWIDVEPAQLAGADRQELRARVTAPGVDYAFTVAVERGEDSLVLVGLTPLGTKSFEVERHGKRVRVANHMGVVSIVPPRNILADVTGILLASPCDAAQSGEARAEFGRWRVTDTCSGGRVQRRHVEGPGEVGNVDISYDGNQTVVSQHDCGYEAQYVSVGTVAAAAPISRPASRAEVRSDARVAPPVAREPVASSPDRPVADPAAPAPRADATVSGVDEPRRAEPADSASALDETASPARGPASLAPAVGDDLALAAPVVTPQIQAILDDLDRSDADSALDAGRKPGELLAFLEVEPGMRVAELGAGGGYTAELLARAVGVRGTVYGQNSKVILERFAEKPWSERLSRPVMRKVVRVDREFSDPLPPDARNLDLVVMNLFYHDTVWMKADRDAMNRAIYRALAPGGRYVVIDHSARRGRGIQDVETMHRIEESVVRGEILRAGFRLRRHAEFLRNPSDTRDWNDSPRAAGDKRGTSDRFVLEFVK